MKTTIRFYSGLDTIGAVIMEVKYGKNRAFFEAGTAFNPSFDMFDGLVDKRKSIVKDYLWINEIPNINYIYRKEDISGLDLKPACDYDGNQAFFISHLHLDHMRMMGLIDPSIPVYLTENAQTIEFAQENAGIGVDSIRGHQYSDMQEDTYVGDIHVHRFILNDDSYQDLSFYIETPDLKLHYTGDIFVYGKYFNNIQNEIKYLNEKDIDILIPEGTTFWSNFDDTREITPTFTPYSLLSKDEQQDKLINIIKDYQGLVVFNCYEREMSDVMELTDIAQKTSRTLVFEPISAYIINRFFNKSVNYIIPDTYKDEPDYLKYVKQNNTLINKSDIIVNPDKYLVQNTYANILELLDYRDLNLLYLHYAGQPIGDFDPKYKTMMNLINSLGFDFMGRSRFEDGTFFSSHATPEQLLAYQDAIKCKLIIPLHTANRTAYCKYIKKPYFWANLNETYEYDKENNTMKVVEYE